MREQARTLSGLKLSVGFAIKLGRADGKEEKIGLL